MTQFSMFPWTTGGAGDGASPYTQEQANDFFRYFDVRDPASEGVARGVLNELAVSGAASPLNVASGVAICYGRYFSDSGETLAVTTPSLGTTGGRVVLRADWTARTIRLAVKMSADGVATIPALTQSFGSTWEISLATFTITTGGVISVTDDRTFRRATAVVDNTALLDNAVSAAKIQNLAVTTDKLANLAVTTGKLANDSVDDTKVGNRVAQFYRRQGASPTRWALPGTTDYTPTAVRVQFGVVESNGSGVASVSFPVPFSEWPIVIASPFEVGVDVVSVQITNIDADSFTAGTFDDEGNLEGNIDVHWIAIGPE